MKPSILNRHLTKQLLAVTAITFWAGSSAHAADQIWRDAGTNNNWSTVGTDLNWDAGVVWVNSGTNAAIFGNSGSGVGESITLTEDITANGLNVSNSNATGYSFNLASGIDLNVNGNVTIGANAVNSTTNATLTGAGSFVVTNSGGTIQIGGATGASNYNRATLDMSGLAAFSADLGSAGIFRIGDTSTTSIANGASTVILADDSAITAASLRVGSDSGNSVVLNTLKLGATENTIKVNNVFVSNSSLAGSISNRSSGAIQFNVSTGTLNLRAADGIGRSNLYMVYTNNTTSAALNATADLSGHSSDLLLTNLVVAYRNGTSGGGATATFTMDEGTLDVTDVKLAQSGTGNACNGTMTLGGGSGTLGVTVGTSGIRMTSGTGSTSIGTLNLKSGATVTMNGNIFKSAGGTAVLNLQGATLDMNGKNIGGSGQLVTLNAESGTLKNLTQLNNGGTLTKTTAGTLILSGTNTYTGDTTVDGGILSLAAASLAEASTVSIASGAILNLNHSETDTIDKLFINGVQQAAGLYKSSTAAGAGTVLASLTGDGKLDVTTGPANTFATWMASFDFSAYPGANLTATGDADGDGIGNLVEHVFGTAPNAPTTGLSQISATASSVTFQHPLNPSVASDVTYSYQWSSDLSEWKAGSETNTGDTTTAINAGEPVADVVTVTATISDGPATKLFVRIVAHQNP